MQKEKEAVRKFRCLSCGREFEHEGKPEKCPFCRCRMLTLLEGESTRQHSAGGCSSAG